jgi:tetratricopeptide (TPR) repeat protein
VTETGLKRATDLYKAALDIEPDYPEALVGLTAVQIALPYFSTVSPDEQSERRAYLAHRLTAIDPASPEAHYVAGSLETIGGWDWAKARSDLDEAIRLDPSHYFYRWVRAQVELFMGDLKNSGEMVLEALKLNPDDALMAGWTGQFLCVGGRFRESIEILEPWITREPSHPFPPLFCGVSYIALGDVEKGFGLIERAREISDGAPWTELMRCNVLHLAGRHDEAAAVAADLVDRSGDGKISPYIVSSALLQIGDVERSLDYLEQALESRDPILPGIGGGARWRPLYGNPRFDAVFQKVFPGREPLTAE